MRRQRKHHGYGARRTPTANGVAIAFDTTTTHSRPAVPYSWRVSKKQHTNSMESDHGLSPPEGSGTAVATSYQRGANERDAARALPMLVKKEANA